MVFYLFWKIAYLYKSLLDSPAFNFFSHYPIILFMCVYTYTHTHTLPICQTMQKQPPDKTFYPQMPQHESPRGMHIVLHNLSSVITSLKTNIIHHTDHTHVFSGWPQSIFYSLCFFFLIQDPVMVTQCICLLYLLSLTQCTMRDSPHHCFPPFFMMNESFESSPVVLQNVPHSGLVWYYPKMYKYYRYIKSELRHLWEG